MIKSVYFGCGIVQLHTKEENELKRIYEAILLSKLRFRKKFPRTALYSRKCALGIGLMTPSTIIDILKLKMHVGNKQKKRNVVDAVSAQENMQKEEARQNIIIGENSEQRYQKAMQIDQINNLLWKRYIQLNHK